MLAPTMDLALLGVTELDSSEASAVDGGSPPKVVLAVWLVKKFGPPLARVVAEGAAAAAGTYAAGSL